MASIYRVKFLTVSTQVQNIIKRCYNLVSNRGIQNFNTSGELGANNGNVIGIVNNPEAQGVFGLNLLWTMIHEPNFRRIEQSLTSWMAS